MGIWIYLLIVLCSLFFSGVIIRAKSFFSGRKGPGIFQPIRDIRRLLCKGAVYSDTSSFIFQVAPGISLASVLMAVALIPFGARPGFISFQGDFVFFACILALGKFFNIISALDTGSSFEGMGASREALYSMLAEPAFFILMGTFALITGHSSFASIFGAFHTGNFFSGAAGILAAVVMLLIALVDNSRMPVDDPKTHLELTMVHEVMILDNSGFDLGLILYSGHLKFAMYGALIANFLMIPRLVWYLAVPVFIGMQICLAILIGLIESFMARYRMSRNPGFVMTLSSISILIFLGVWLMMGKIR